MLFRKKLVIFMCVLALLLVSSQAASAHSYSISFTRVTFTADETIVEFAIDDVSVIESVQGADLNNDYYLDQEETADNSDILKNWVKENLLIELNGKNAAAQKEEVTFHDEPPFKSSFQFETEFDYSKSILPDTKFIRVELRYPARQAGGSFKIKDSFYPGELENYGNFLNIIDNGKIRTTILFGSKREFVLDDKSLSENPAAAGVDWLRFFALGFEHILFGYDHLLFLFSLVIFKMRYRELIKVITSFTVAHSITLALAVLGIIALPAKLVEAAIAISIIYVALENIFLKDQEKHRWWITFLFGLIHGLGFARMLMQISLPTSQLLAALIGFNVGIETTQAALMLLLLPIIRYWQSSAWFGKTFAKVNVFIILIASVWLIQRIS